MPPAVCFYLCVHAHVYTHLLITRPLPTQLYNDTDSQSHLSSSNWIEKTHTHRQSVEKLVLWVHWLDVLFHLHICYVNVSCPCPVLQGICSICSMTVSVSPGYSSFKCVKLHIEGKNWFNGWRNILNADISQQGSHTCIYIHLSN